MVPMLMPRSGMPQGIAIAHPPISVAAYLYNTQDVSVLQHVAQMRYPPERLKASERKAVRAILHFAGNVITHNDSLNLHIVGGPNLRAAWCASLAALFATSIRFLDTLREWLGQIRATAENYSRL